MTIRHCVNHIKVPAYVSLTPVVLVAAMRKLPTETIADTVEALLAELDTREGDPDLEPEVVEVIE